MPSLPPALRLAFLSLALVACASQSGRHAVYTASARPADQLAAVEERLAADDAAEAGRILARIDAARLDRRQRLHYQLLQAEVALAEEKPLVALQALPPFGEWRDAQLSERAERDRALALFRMGDAVGATQTLVTRERLLADDAQRRAGRELLWNSLRTADLDSAVGARLAQTDAVSRGWVELAVISRSVWTNAAALKRRVAEWRSAYPDHPAEERLASLAEPQPLAQGKVRAIGLLLPLSGPFAATGEAVRDGFLAALYRAEGPRPSVRVYDTGTSIDTLQAAYRRALDDGAEFLVGPLRKEDVAAMVDAGRPAVPVLALNYLDAGRTAPFNFYQWGLAPEDEARQAAERAVTDHRYRAVALVPEGEWGERVLRAFEQRFVELGGTLADARTYSDKARDHSEPIRALLAVDASEGRHDALTGILGIKTKFEPRRRDDVDLIFMAARPDQAKLIWPQFRFHRATDLPAYATAMVYDGEAPAADLNGLRFCDMPWMLAHDGEWTTLRNQLRTLFPQRGREYTRLLALGHDSFTLVALIESGQLGPGVYYPAASGTLSMREDGVITRGVTCAEIRNGALKPLDLAVVPPDARR